MAATGTDDREAAPAPAAEPPARFADRLLLNLTLGLQLREEHQRRMQVTPDR